MVRESQESVKTPHRIELCEELPIRPVRTCRKRRIITATPPKTENTEIKAEPALKKNTVKSKPLKSSNRFSNMTNGHSIRPRGLKGSVRGIDNHKVTEYFTGQIKSPKAEPLSPPAIEKTFEETKAFEQKNAFEKTKTFEPTGIFVEAKTFEPTKTFKQTKTVKVMPKISNGDNHKLTEYFPVRRSVRKTSKCVMAERMRDLERAIREHREDGLAVKYFEGKGRGVVATRPFSRGDFVVEYIGELVGPAEAREREQKYAEDPNAGCYMYYFRHGNQQYCIDATAESNKLGRLVNHSRNGNLLTKAVWVDGPRLVLLAAQDIAPGEELMYDYGDRSKESLQHHPWLAL